MRVRAVDQLTLPNVCMYRANTWNHYVRRDEGGSFVCFRTICSRIVKIAARLVKTDIPGLSCQRYLPKQPIEIYIAADGPEAAEMAAEFGDGLIGVTQDKELIPSFSNAGGKEDCTYGQVAICYADSVDKAVGPNQDAFFKFYEQEL